MPDCWYVSSALTVFAGRLLGKVHACLAGRGQCTLHPSKKPKDSFAFVDATQVPDRKQKGRALGAADNPEYQMLDAIKQGMQLNPVAADALTKEIKGLTGE